MPSSDDEKDSEIQLKLFKENRRLNHFEGTLSMLSEWLIAVYDQLVSKEYRYQTKDLPYPLDDYMRYARLDANNSGKVPYDFQYEIDDEFKCLKAMLDKFGQDKSVSEIVNG